MMSDGATAAQKAALRHQMLLRLRRLNDDARKIASNSIREQVLASSEWQKANGVAFFVPFANEPDVAPLHEAAHAAQKRVTIIEPALRAVSELQFEEAAVDLILVPGLAFSREGHRLGRGGGFFDRLLAGRGAHAHKLGICFAFQLLDEIPRERHDVLMNAVVTDRAG
jgi:5-formyltetrahydrofolate cyclo-ligase